MPKCVCPHCDKTYDVPESYIGKPVKCGRCKQSFQADVDFMESILSEDEPVKPVGVLIVPESMPTRRAPSLHTPQPSLGKETKKGCAGCLRMAFYVVAICAAVLIALAILSLFLQPRFPYTLDRTIEDQSGNVMAIYFVSGESTPETLRKFCSYRKSRAFAGNFYLITIFDAKKNVVEPTTRVLTGGYGMFNKSDEEASKHIIATYANNRRNGFSKLTYYGKNQSESLPMTLEVP